VHFRSGSGVCGAWSDVRWVLGPTSPACADCDETRWGRSSPGEEFPTGHRHPPAHAGCRCLVVRRRNHDVRRLGSPGGTPQDIATPTPARTGRGGGGSSRRCVLVLVLASLRSLASFWTRPVVLLGRPPSDVGHPLHGQAGLFATFGAIFFVCCGSTCWSATGSAYQSSAMTRRGAGAALPAADPALCPACLCRHRLRARPGCSRRHHRRVANWLLFSNGVSFGIKDPQFGKDVGFFVFKLPFLSFLVNWSSSPFWSSSSSSCLHYLNGGSGPAGHSTVRPS